MATVVSPPTTARDAAVVLRHVSWRTYESLLADYLDSSAPRFTYDRGVLEIVSPSFEHEQANRTLALLVQTVASELSRDVLGAGSTTFKREDLQRGFEPDSCFYVQHASRLRGQRRIDLTIDPPPDLVIEIDVSRSSLDKLSLYARMGVPEVWRFDGERIVIHLLEAGLYRETEHSSVLPPLTSQVLLRFLVEGRSLSLPEWLRSLSEWVRAQRAADDGP